MMESITIIYSPLKIIHLVSLISLMAGLLYLPRLFVYHAMQELGSGQAKMLEIMEYKLLKYIVNPALVLTLFSGVTLGLLFFREGNGLQHWVYAKLLCFGGLIYFHVICCKYRKQFLLNTNFKTHKHFRFFNEIPTVLMIIMVCLAVIK